MKNLLKTVLLVIALTVLVSCSTMQELLDTLSDSLDTTFRNSENTDNGTPDSASRDNTPREFQIIDRRTPIAEAAASILPKNYTLPASYETAYSYRTDTPNQLMRNIPRNIEAIRTNNPDEYIQQVVELINKNAENDFEKVKMAHDIVALLVRYDAASFWAGTISDQNYRSVLKNRLAVCEGYANVFKKFCDVLRIPCDIVHGFGRGVGSTSLSEDNPTESNHAWNIVIINGESYLVDCTWDSGFMDGRTSKQQYTTDWLFLKPEHFLYTHYPENLKQQLLVAPLTANQFSALPFFKPKFFEMADDISINLQRINQIDNALSFEYTVKEGHRLSFRINDIRTGREIQNRYFIQTDDTKETVYFSFPSVGQYSINIFWFENDARQGEGCGEFVVETSSESTTLYPTVYSSSVQNLQIISPIEMPLKRGGVYTFTVRAENKNVAALIYGRTFVPLTKGENGIFSTDFQIPNNIRELSIGTANSERGRYEIVAQYTVN